MRVVIDLQAAQTASRLRGIGRYSLSLVEALARIKGPHEIIVALSDAFPETLVPLRARLEPLVGDGNVRVWSAPMPVRGEDRDNHARRMRAEAIYDAFLASLGPDLIFVSSLFEGYIDDAVTTVGRLSLDVPVAVTLYDLIPLRDPDRHLKHSSRWETFYHEKVSALERADLLLAISEFSAADAAARLGGGNRRIVNMSGACSDMFMPSAMPEDARARLRTRLGIDRPYVITSGTVEPHKNLPNLFKAFAHLPKALRTRHKIVLVGYANDNQVVACRKMCAKAGVPMEALVVTGYISDDDLVALYSDASLMVFPSMDEGFGLPPLEAMSCGTPTIGSHASSIPEVIGMAEAMFDPSNPVAMSALIRRGLEDDAFRAKLKANAAERAAAFSWEKTAQTAMAAMADLVAARPVPKGPVRPALEACLDALAATAPTAAERPALARALAFDFPQPDRKPHLFVDVSELRLRDVRTGCQRVTRSVLQAWLETPPGGFEVMPVYATTNRQGYVAAQEYLAKLTGLPLREPDAAIDYAPGDVFFGLDLHPLVVAAQKPYLQQMRRRGVRTRFLVHDLLPIQMPQHFPPGTAAGFEAWVDTICVTDGIVGNSHSTVKAFRTVAAERGILPEGLFGYDHVHLGADIENSVPTTGLAPDADAVLASIAARPSFLSVGTVEPRKGHAQTLGAFEALWARGADVNLVLVGKAGWNVDALVQRLRTHPELGRRLFWLEGISDEYLARVYAATTCLLAASEAEGFGLPLIEAAQAGLPILARDIDVFHEVAGPNAAYFDAQSADQFALAIQDWLTHFREGRAPSSRGLQWLTWAECAARLGRIALSPPSSDPPDGIVVERVTGFVPSEKRILVSKLDHMGDLLLALPALSRLRARYPKARLDLLCGSWNEAAARQTGLFHTVYTHDYFKQKSSVAPQARERDVADLQARIGHCDLAIDLRRQSDSRFILVGINAAVRIGYATGVADIDGRLTTALAHWNDVPFEATPLNCIHISRQMLDLVDAIPAGIDDYIVLPPLAAGLVSEKAREIAIFPKAGNAIKEWGDARFLELAQGLAQVEEVAAVNCYFATKAEAAAAGFHASGKIKVHAGLGYAELLQSVSGCSTCVANNSFGAHVASYLGVETVGIYGGQETSTEWGPCFGRNTVIRRPVPCSPCHLPTPADCRHNLRCLDIPVSLVQGEVMKAFSRSSLQKTGGQ